MLQSSHCHISHHVSVTMCFVHKIITIIIIVSGVMCLVSVCVLNLIAQLLVFPFSILVFIIDSHIDDLLTFLAALLFFYCLSVENKFFLFTLNSLNSQVSA